MKVVSLFDGKSCGRIALERAGKTVDKYYASEIDKYAMFISNRHYPEIIQLGNVLNLRIPKGEIIDLLLGGSPCQGFSVAGKQLNFNDPRSKLFFEYLRILKEARRYNPGVKFLLENVKMKKEYQNIISDLIGVEPIEINSALVSAQNRKRLYWTNIKGVQQPEDKGIILESILENSFNEKPLSAAAIERIKRKKYSNPKIMPEKTGTLNTKNNSGQLSIDAGTTLIPIILNPDKSYCIDANYHKKCLSDYLNRARGQMILLSENSYRKLSPLECERLQTLPDNYTAGVSDSQRYKMIGNGWTVDVIAHILKYL